MFSLRKFVFALTVVALASQEAHAYGIAIKSPGGATLTGDLERYETAALEKVREGIDAYDVTPSTSFEISLDESGKVTDAGVKSGEITEPLRSQILDFLRKQSFGTLPGFSGQATLTLTFTFRELVSPPFRRNSINISGGGGSRLVGGSTGVPLPRNAADRLKKDEDRLATLEARNGSHPVVVMNARVNVLKGLIQNKNYPRALEQIKAIKAGLESSSEGGPIFDRTAMQLASNLRRYPEQLAEPTLNQPLTELFMLMETKSDSGISATTLNMMLGSQGPQAAAPIFENIGGEILQHRLIKHKAETTSDVPGLTDLVDLSVKLKKFDDAVKLQKRIVAIRYREPDGETKIRASIRLAELGLNAGKPEVAQEGLQSAIEVSNLADKEMAASFAPSLATLAGKLADNGMLDTADSAIRRSIQYSLENPAGFNGLDSAGIDTTANDLIATYRRKGMFDKAISLQRYRIEKTGAKRDVGFTYQLQDNLASLLLAGAGRDSKKKEVMIAESDKLYKEVLDGFMKQYGKTSEVFKTSIARRIKELNASGRSSAAQDLVKLH